MLLSDQMKSLDCTYYMIDKLVPKSTLVLVLSSIFSQKSITCHHTCSFGIKTDIYLSNAREVTRTIHKDKWGATRGEFGWIFEGYISYFVSLLLFFFIVFSTKQLKYSDIWLWQPRFQNKIIKKIMKLLQTEYRMLRIQNSFYDICK